MNMQQYRMIQDFSSYVYLIKRKFINVIVVDDNR